MKNSIAFGWYGGKYTHLSWLLPHLPESTTFVDVFGGSASVVLNRLDKCEVPIYNDKFSRLVNFFRQLRENPDELIAQLELTPHSREEHSLAREISENPIEDARRFFILTVQSFMGIYGKRWAYTIKDSRRGMGSVTSKFIERVEGLKEIVERLKLLQIENLCALDILKRYDSEETLFYLDPPYLLESRKDKNCYKFEMTDEEHRDLAQAAKQCRGKVAISGYMSDTMKELYQGWYCFSEKEKQCGRKQGEKSLRQEFLWTNYFPFQDKQMEIWEA